MKKTLFKTLLFSTAVLSALVTRPALAESSETDNLETQRSSLVVEQPTSQTTSNQTGEITSREEYAEVTIEEYSANVAGFKKVTIGEVHTIFTADGSEHTIYVGRGSCYHCRQFSPVLKEFNTLISGNLNYYDVDSEDFDEEAKEYFFNTLGIPGTPTVLYVKNGQPVSGWVGGGITAQQLYDNLYLPKDEEEKSGSNEEVLEDKKVTQTAEAELKTEVEDSDKNAVNNASNVKVDEQFMGYDKESQQDTSLVRADKFKPKAVIPESKIVSTSESKFLLPVSSRTPTLPKVQSSARVMLPKTGEEANVTFYQLGLLLVLGTLGITVTQIKNKNKI